MTTNLKRFAIFCLLWSVAFFATLHWALLDAAEYGGLITVAAIVYGIGFAVAGFVLGKGDSAHQTRTNLPLAYYVTSLLASLLVGGIWTVGWRPSEWKMLAIMSVVFGFFLAVAFVSSRRTVKGMSKDQLFR